MRVLLEMGNIFRIAAFILFALMTFEKKVLFFKNDRIYFLGICILSGLGFFPSIIRILPFVSWTGIRGMMGIFLGLVFLGVLVFSFSKWNKKDFDGYNHLAAMILFIMMVQWFLLTSAANT